MNTRAIYLVLVLSVLIAVGYFSWVGSFNQNSAVRLWGYDLEKVDGGEGIEFLLYQSENEKLEVTRIGSVNGTAAQRLIDEKVTLFGALFEEQRVGYSGQHTEFISCPDEFKPKLFHKELDQGSITYFAGFANNRFSHGACLEEDIYYQALNLYLYCKSEKVLLDINFFARKDIGNALEDFVRKLNCLDI